MLGAKVGVVLDWSGSVTEADSLVKKVLEVDIRAKSLEFVFRHVGERFQKIGKMLEPLLVFLPSRVRITLIPGELVGAQYSDSDV